MSRKGPDARWKGLQISAEFSDALTRKAQVYDVRYTQALDTYGFVRGCDGLLFTSLLVASGRPQPISLAEDQKQPGKWHRSALQDCLVTGQSKSTISRDMLLGLALALWQTKDGAAITRLLAFSEKSKGILGEATDRETLLSRTSMSPGLLALYSEMNFLITGTTSASRGYFPEVQKPLFGFEAHLQVLNLILKAALYGGIISQDLNVMKRLAESEVKNALFQAVYHGFTDGDGSSVARILLDTSLFPETSLPSSRQRCEPYLWQRVAATADWKPCIEKSEEHPAVDFIWVKALIDGTFLKPI